MQPQSRHDEEQFDADSSEGKNAAQSNAENRVSVPDLIGDMSGDLVGADGGRDDILLETEVTADEDKGGRNAEPKSNQSSNGRQGSSSRRSLGRDIDIDGQESQSHDTRVEGSSEESVLLPFLASAKLVDSGGRVSGKGAHENIEQQQGSEQSATVGRRSKSKKSASHGSNSHSKNLETRSGHHREKRGRGGRRAEDIAMNQLPARLLVSIVEGLHLVVGGDILVQSTQHDHSHDTGQEEHHHQRVNDSEEVDFVVGVALEVDIPTLGPADL